MKILFITKETFSIFLTALTFTFLPLVLFTLITSQTNLLPGFHTYTVVTGSMAPLIPTGSIVYDFQSNSYKLGDIISFERGKINVTHRIVGIEQKDGRLFYQTKGDSNNAPDNDLVPENKVTGEILFHFPYVGKFVSYLKTVPGFLAFIAFPTLVFIGFELWNIKKEVEKETEKKVLKKVLKTIQTYG